jgi:hypothetical protein
MFKERNHSCQGSVLAKNPFMPRICLWYDFIHGKNPWTECHYPGCLKFNTRDFSVKYVHVNKHNFTSLFNLFSCLSSYVTAAMILGCLSFNSLEVQQNWSQIILKCQFSSSFQCFNLHLILPCVHLTHSFLHSISDNFFDFSHVFLHKRSRCKPSARKLQLSLS